MENKFPKLDKSFAWDFRLISLHKLSIITRAFDVGLY